jgi:NDP-sugar pyrophosphorylase family protein
MTDRNLMILAAGASSRMRKAADAALPASLAEEAASKTKSMIGLGPGGRPFLDYLLFNARQAGYVDILLVVSEQSEAIRSAYGPREEGNDYHGLSIGYAVQRIPEGRTKPLGTADAVMAGLRSRPRWSHARFSVCNSDNLYSVNALRTVLESPSPCSMIDYDCDALGCSADRVAQFSILLKDPNGSLIDIIEKPSADEIARCSTFGGRVGVSMNLFRFQGDLIQDAIRQTPVHPVRGEQELPTAVVQMIRNQPGCLATYPFSEEVPDLTGRGDIGTVQHYLAAHYPNFSWT